MSAEASVLHSPKDKTTIGRRAIRSSALQMPPDVVIRSSGIWDTRAPYHRFTWGMRYLLRRHFSLEMAAVVFQQALPNTQVSSKELAKILKVKNTKEGSHAYQRYRKMFTRNREAGELRPSLRDYHWSAKGALFEWRKSTIVSIAGMFETYVQCWALNVLLAKLEGGLLWSQDEREVARELSPVHRTRSSIITWRAIMKRMPATVQSLSGLPNMSLNRSSGEIGARPVSAEDNCLRTIDLWRDYRNLVVHAGGLVSNAFRNRQGKTFDLLRQQYGEEVGPLTTGSRVPLWPGLIPAVARVHGVAADWMRAHLMELSQEKRGHPDAPGSAKESYYCSEYKPVGRLLIAGDHAPSVQWEIEANRRRPRNREVARSMPLSTDGSNEM